MPPEDFDTPTTRYYEGILWQEPSVMVAYDAEQGCTVFIPMETVLDAEIVLEDILDAEVIG